MNNRESVGRTRRVMVRVVGRERVRPPARTRGWIGPVAAGLSVLSLVACGASGDGNAERTPNRGETTTSASSVRTSSGCAKEIHELSDEASVVGCGKDVLIREDDLNAALDSDGWSEDTGIVNRSIDTVQATDCDSSTEDRELEVVGAQTVEIGDYNDTGELDIWQDVLVFEDAAQGKQFYESRVASLACIPPGDSLPKISPDQNFSGAINDPVVSLETGERDVVLSSGGDDFEVAGRPVAILTNGRYYSELYLDASWLEGGTLNETGKTVVALARSRMARG